MEANFHSITIQPIILLLITKNYKMKKLVLSSIIMLGVCGIASAQTDSKLAKQKQASTSSSSAALTPQKAAFTPASDVVTAPAVATATSTDQEAAAATKSATQTAQKAESTTVNAAGEVVPATDAKRREAKMAAAKAANAPKGKQN